MSEVVDIRGSVMQTPTFSAEIHEGLIAGDDYFRYATLGLALRRILVEDIPGAVAEVGVYRGDMSRFIHSLTPQRTLYLFDTFEGFPPSDVQFEGHSGMFRDTSVELVMEKVGNSNQVRIRKGYVPDTLAGLEHERFAFVLLDVDLYKPMKDSLQFFYPRLSRGGYLVVHDYNNPPNPSLLVNRALTEFMADKPERIIEIADKWGSVLFRKI
jgi:O-methyltransferase